MKETEVTNVYLFEGNNSHRKLKYKIKTGKSLDEELITHCIIKTKKILNGKSKLRIIARYPVGGGMYGLNSCNEKIDIINSSDFSEKLLLDYAKKYAKKFAEEHGYNYRGLIKTQNL